MNIIGKWELVSAKGLDTNTFDDVWMTDADLKELDTDNPYKMLAGATFEFLEDGRLLMKNAVAKVSDVPADELKAALEDEKFIEEDGFVKTVTPYAWKEENGIILMDTKEEAEIFGEKIDPWKPVEEDGNTIILDSTYQIVRAGETPSVVRKTVKEEKVVSEETKSAAGTYKGLYTKFVGDPDSARNEKDEFRLVLEADGTGKSFRNDLDIDVSDWSVEDGKFKLTEKFIGTIDYTGTLEGSRLVLFNGDPENDLTCSYVFEKTE